MALTLQRLKQLLTPADSSRSILPFIPRPIRYILLFILLLNARSWPFVWHFRVFRPLIYLRTRSLSLIGKSKEEKRKWYTALSPVGEHPLEKVSVWKSWASPDDSDFNLHLSNSSYAKSLDSARFKSALASFPLFFGDGGWIALGATHFRFIREIPIHSPYQVRVRVAAWDQKWMYVVAQFITFPPKTSKSKLKQPQSLTKGIKDILDKDSAESNFAHAHIQTPANGLDTPAVFTPPVISSSTSAPGTSWASSSTLPEGAVLNCVSVSQLCCKHGRSTVPPSLVIAGSGFLMAPDSDEWAMIQGMRKTGEMKKLVKGGWREVPEEDRWWDSYLKGTGIIDRVERNLKEFDSMRNGVEAITSL
ncbi:hypothetical protein SISNIDRAFT_415311 [Sistotremastrum niveocremeum HHB9708]|uniref:Thioesterase/thiol ester dehydrase-isomerase n=1 Tax=Sistotremastrum niveocremeum HHB9708 TaxID=1314777 RepID=A0A164REG0_9AGAM|nr:hypothetical protein SISNIDRAFT_415311 [Sistotremastrum niveocremeum HHB9708]